MGCKLLVLLSLALLALLWSTDADCATVPAGFADIDISGYWDGIAGLALQFGWQAILREKKWPSQAKPPPTLFG